MTREQIRQRLTGDRNQRLRPLAFWAEMDAALDDPAVTIGVLLARRQIGKSQYLLLRAIENLLLRPSSFTLFVSASSDQAQALFRRKVRLPLVRLLRAAGLSDNTLTMTERSAENPALGSAIEVIAANEATAPSRAVDLLIIDEARYVGDELFASLIPSILAVRGKAAIGSTPGEPSGFFHALCTGDDPAVRVVRPVATDNPGADPTALSFLHRLLQQVLPVARLRDLEAQFAESGDQAIPGALWDSRVEPTWGPAWSTKEVPLFMGADLALTGDTAAIVDVLRDGDQIILAGHRIWRPTMAHPLDFTEVEDYITQRARQFYLDECRVDPYQAARSCAQLRAKRLPMVEYPQTVGNITTMVATLLDCLQSGALVLYPSDELREQATNAIILNAGRGFKFAKERGSRKIDALIALSMAVTAAVEAPSYAPAFVI